MKRIFITIISFCFLLHYGCSKDFLKRYDKRIIGSWRISDVNRVGLGGNTDNLPFSSGNFIFYNNGTLDYTSSLNVNFKGSWEIIKKQRNNNTVHSLQINAVDFTNQQVLSEYYDDINFVGTNHFKANINYNFQVYVTHFRR